MTRRDLVKMLYLLEWTSAYVLPKDLSDTTAIGDKVGSELKRLQKVLKEEIISKTLDEAAQSH